MSTKKEIIDDVRISDYRKSHCSAHFISCAFWILVSSGEEAREAKEVALSDLSQN